MTHLREQDPSHAFYQQHYRGVFFFFLSRNYIEADAHEMTQETFLRFFKSTNEEKETPVRYLKVIAANLWRNSLRENSASKRDGKTLPLQDAQLLPSQQPTPLTRIIHEEQKDVLRKAIIDLPAQMRHCMIMRVYQGLKYKEIATILKLNIQTVKSQLSQAKARLKNQLSDYFHIQELGE